MKANKSNGTVETEKNSTEDFEALQLELQKSQKAAAENLELAQAAQVNASNLQGKLSNAETDLESAATVIGGLKAELSKAQEAIAAKDEEIEELKQALIEEKEEDGDKQVTFTYEGIKYEILGAVKIPGSEHPSAYTALEIAAEESLQAILVSRKSGMIREIK